MCERNHFEKNGIEIDVRIRFDRSKVELAIMKLLGKEEMHSSQLQRELFKGMIPDDLGRVETCFILTDMLMKELIEGDFKMISENKAGKFYRIKGASSD